MPLAHDGTPLDLGVVVMQELTGSEFGYTFLVDYIPSSLSPEEEKSVTSRTIPDIQRDKNMTTGLLERGIGVASGMASVVQSTGAVNVAYPIFLVGHSKI